LGYYRQHHVDQRPTCREIDSVFVRELKTLGALSDEISSWDFSRAYRLGALHRILEIGVGPELQRAHESMYQNLLVFAIGRGIGDIDNAIEKWKKEWSQRRKWK
jgi:hypothetical protein